ncbi:hypothetical protein RVBP17_2530 [Pseudomonas phage sp. 30-3]|uniref:Uncharacterized protein n=1 Tax=Pseudomonas phage vB_PaeM_PA5oct TaxID=2163605 RepID=A0A4Y1LV54_9CAUD|nr:hypothetical protein PQE65_gp141 [Pseudomonas phage vB_PaeM_PA5oct]WMI31887.1 hypothetical protein GBBBJNDB_00184 [Pseudomonas phage Callisto]WPK38820.1 hypothetical protein Cassandra_0144 [Pseudomonas phage Cassandra]WPK39853.1 hypothetical protein ETTORE_0144 [Pseudomonas phage Ettore]WPK40374.1 hypothetical protein Paride_0144 [Pseudomonas phage Paride]VOH54710.1 hypothetical protein MIJ3_00184 [Pseudomonas phage vB_PaeM_MIJ3]BDR25704.1 hypothetical protein RVBP16_1440 [Pseudomonas phag
MQEIKEALEVKGINIISIEETMDNITLKCRCKDTSEMIEKVIEDVVISALDIYGKFCHVSATQHFNIGEDALTLVLEKL